MIPIKRLAVTISVCFIIVLLHGVLSAQTLWVKPSSEITMRRGQGTDFKIVAVVKDGTPIALLEEQGDWAQIRLESGKEGWVLRRFLSDMPPLGEQVALLQGEKETLTRTTSELKLRFDGLTAEKEQVEQELTSQRTQIEQQLNACIADLDSINNQYMALQDDTADVIKTKKNLTDARTQIDSLQKELSRYKQENEQLSKNETLKWFLAGGGVLFLGWIIGLISRRSKKKRPSLL